ncbi:MAG: hypothetical protein R3C01_05220 [Planctomycetaceae bacterium]
MMGLCEKNGLCRLGWWLAVLSFVVLPGSRVCAGDAVEARFPPNTMGSSLVLSSGEIASLRGRTVGIVPGIAPQDVIARELFSPYHGEKPIRVAVDHSKGSNEYLHLYRDPEHTDRPMVLMAIGAMRQGGFGLMRMNDAQQLEAVVQFGGAMREPTFEQHPDGDILIGSRTGAIYRWTGQQLMQHNIPLPPGEGFNTRKLFREVHFACYPGGPTCCYSIADRQFHTKALFDVVVSTPTGWKTIPLKADITGPGCMTDAKTFRMMTYKEFLTVDLESDVVTKTEFPTPGPAEDKLRPEKLVSLPDGTLISLWRRPFRSYHRYDMPTFEDGSYFRIAEWKRDRWEFAPLNIDRMLYEPQHHVVDSDGGLWLGSTDGALVYRSPAGEWRRFDENSGIHSGPIRRMQFVPPKHLWLSDKSGLLLKIDLPQLLATEPRDSARWATVCGEEVWENGQLMRDILRTHDGRVAVLTRAGVQFVDNSFPDKFPEPKDPYERYDLLFSLDSRGDLWCRHSLKHDLLAWRHQGTWQYYEPIIDVDGTPLTAQEAAVMDLLNRGYTDGDRVLNAHFGPGRQIVIAQIGSVSYFDGQKWFVNREHRDTTALVRHVEFREHGILMKDSRDLYYYLPHRFWETADADKVKRPWRVLGRLLPQETEEETAAYQQQIASTVPIQRPFGITGTEQGVFAANGKQIAFYCHDLWTVVDDTIPAYAALRYRSRDITFVNGNVLLWDDGECLVYHPEPTKISPTTLTLPAVDQPGRKLLPKVQFAPAVPDAMVRYRNGWQSWSAWQPLDQPFDPGPRLPGTYWLFAQYQSPTRLMLEEPIRYEYEVTYDIRPKVRQLVRQLGSEEQAERTAAMQELLNGDTSTIDYLYELHAASVDSEIKARVMEVIEQLTKQGR